MPLIASSHREAPSVDQIQEPLHRPKQRDKDRKLLWGGIVFPSLASMRAAAARAGVRPFIARNRSRNVAGEKGGVPELARRDGDSEKWLQDTVIGSVRRRRLDERRPGASCLIPSSSVAPEPPVP